MGRRERREPSDYPPLARRAAASTLSRWRLRSAGSVACRLLCPLSSPATQVPRADRPSCHCSCLRGWRVPHTSHERPCSHRLSHICRAAPLPAWCSLTPPGNTGRQRCCLTGGRRALQQRCDDRRQARSVLSSQRRTTRLFWGIPSRGEPRGHGGHVQLGVGGRLRRGRE